MKIKVCGLTEVCEADYLKENSVDYAGFVLFCPKSKRNVSVEQAEHIMKALGKEIIKTAVVVSPTVAQIQEIQGASFDQIQVHGELSGEALKEITLPIWKAFNVSDLESYQKWRNCEKVKGYVFDAAEPGSGKAFDWNMLEKIPRDEKLFVLAGGLKAENVGKAIMQVHPDVVDVSSGVENDSGKGKDALKIKQFVTMVRNIQN